MKSPTKSAVASALVVAAIAAVPLIMQQREIERLRKTSSPFAPPSASALHLPAPKFVFKVKPTSSAISSPATNPLMEKLLHGEAVPKLTPAQVDNYLAQNQRNAASLLAAFNATGDQTLLREAMQNFPHDPHVDFAAYFATQSSPEDRRVWLDNLKQSDPTNALGNVLSAYDDFQTGQSDLAVQELMAASSKPGWQDYSSDSMQNVEESYRAAGYSDAEAKLIAVSGAPLPQLAQLRDLSKNLVDLANAYQSNGDASSAQASLQMAVTLGVQMTQNPAQSLVSAGTGLLMERQALTAMNPNAVIDNQGHTAQDQLQFIAQQLQTINSVARQEDALFTNFTEADIANYFERQKTFGEAAALQWAQSKYGSAIQAAKANP
jgi:hypothetical protein